MPDLTQFEDFYLDPTTLDFSLDDGGQMLGVQGAERIAQHVRTRIETRRGDWYLDTTVGVPYLEEIFVKDPDLTVIRASLVGEITDVPGVQRIVSLDLTFEAGTRTLIVDFEVLTDDGVLIGGTVP
jgi:hypothetical protein